MAHPAHPCWSRTYNATLPLCGHHQQARRRAADAKEGGGVRVRPVDVEESKTGLLLRASTVRSFVPVPASAVLVL